MSEAKIVLTGEDKTGAAFASAKRGLSDVTALASAAGVSLTALGSAATLAGLVTMVKNIAQGIDEFNDLKDATGASIENISALDSVARSTGGNFETVSASLIKFNQALGTTIKPGSDAERVIKAIGLNAKELRDLDPAEALLKTAVALNGFADNGDKARAVQELFGKSLKEVAPFLKDLAEQGQLNATVTTKQAEEAEKFNKELYKMSAALTDVGRDLAGPVLIGFNGLIDKFREGKKEGDGFIVTLLRQTEIARLMGMSNPGGRSSASGATGSWGEPTALPTLNVPPAPDPKVLADAKRAAEALKKELEDQAKLLAELSGLTGSFAEDWNRLNVIFAKGKLTTEQLTKAQADLLAKQPMMKTQLEEQARATKRLQSENALLVETQEELAQAYVAESKAREQARLAVGDYSRGIDETQERLRLELSLMGATQRVRALAIAQYEIELELKRQIAAIDGTAGFDEAQREEQRARARAAAVQARVNAELKVEIEIADKAGQEWERTNQQIADSFTDNLMRGGKSVAQYLKDLFRTLVLRPMLQPIGNAFASVVGGGGGGGGAMAGAADGGSGLMGLAGNALGLSGIGSAVGTAFTAGSTSVGVMAGSVAGGGGLAGGVAAALGAIPVVGWIALGAAALWAMFGGKGGGPKQDGMYGAGLASGIGQYDNSLQDSVKPIVEGLQTQYDGLAALFGGQGGVKFGMGFSTDPEGDSPSFLDVVGRRDGNLVFNNENRNVGRSKEELTAAMQAAAIDALIMALKESDLSEKYAEYFDGITADASMQAKQAAITVAANAGVVFEAFGRLGPAFGYIGEMSVAATAALVEAGGGIATLTSNLASYYENFYTEEEKRLNVARNISTSLATAGVNMSPEQLLATSRVQFRALVEQFAAMGPAGEASMQALLAVNGAFASITESISDATAALNEAAQAEQERAATMMGLQQERASLFIDLLRASGEGDRADGLQRAIDITGMDAAAIALYDFNQGLRDQIAAANQAAAVAQQRLGLESQILQLEGNTAALRGLELSALDESLRPLQERVYALQDEAAAAATLASIANERYGLETTLLQLQGNTTELRARELELLDPSNRALQEQIWALQDARLAEDQRTASLDRARQAADALRGVWSRLTDGITGEVQRIRALVTADSSDSFAQLQARFAADTAGARAGSQAAAKRLPGASQALLAAGMQSARSMADLQLLRTRTAASLEVTAGYTGARAEDPVVTELKRLREDNKRLRDSTEKMREQQTKDSKALADLTRRSVRVFEKWDKLGLPETAT